MGALPRELGALVKRLALAVAFLLAVPAWAQVFVYTNDVLSLDPLSHPLSFQSGAPMRYTVYPVQAGTPMSVSGLTGQLAVVDRADGATVATYTGAVVDATTFRFSGTVGTSQLRIGGNYQGRGSLYLNGSLVAQISDDYISVVESYCSTCSASGGGGSVTVIYTNLTIINVTNQLDNITNTIENYYTSGVSSVNGQTGPVQIVVTSGGSLSTNGTTLEIAVSGAAQSPLTNSLDGSGNVISNAAARLTGLSAGTGNSDSGTNNVSLTGGTTFFAGAAGNVSAGQAITFGNAVMGSFASGTNNTQNGSYAAESGRENYNSGNYSAVNGYQNRNEAQLAGLLSGDAHTNGSSSIRSVIGGGHRNRIAASVVNAAILGGTNNYVQGSGGQVVGHNSGVGSTGTYGVAIGNGVTNLNPNGTTIGGSGIWLQAPLYMDRQAGVSRTNLLLRSDGVSVYTQIVSRGVIIQ